MAGLQCVLKLGKMFEAATGSKRKLTFPPPTNMSTYTHLTFYQPL